jgi:hypothetical protein
MKIFRKKAVWVPTFSGLLLLLPAAAILLAAVASGVYPFLAQNRPLPDAEMAVIEGWIPDAELAALSVRLPEDTLYVTTGGPIEFGADFFPEKTYAGLTASRLRKFGIDPELILEAPAPETSADRTYVSALAARRMLEANGLFGKPAGIYTVGPHSRRSFLLYRFAFGSEAPLGIIALESSHADLRHWWRNSLAFKKVCTEILSLAYTYCTFWKYD